MTIFRNPNFQLGCVMLVTCLAIILN